MTDSAVLQNTLNSVLQFHVEFFILVSVVIGIPTIKRERDSYLMQTLDSLLDNLSDDERDDVLIVVFIGEVINSVFPLYFAFCKMPM